MLKGRVADKGNVACPNPASASEALGRYHTNDTIIIVTIITPYTEHNFHHCIIQA